MKKTTIWKAHVKCPKCQHAFYVRNHAKITEAEADKAWKLFDEAFAAMDRAFAAMSRIFK